MLVIKNIYTANLIWLEKGVRRASKKGGKGGLSKPRQADPKSCICRRPDPPEETPVACVKPLYQSADGLTPNHPNWTIVTHLNGLVIDNGYEADSDETAGVDNTDSDLNKAPANGAQNHTGRLNADTESASADTVTTGGLSSDDSAIGSTNTPGNASNNCSTNGVNGNIGATVSGGGEGREMGTGTLVSPEGDIGTGNVASVLKPVGAGVGSGVLDIGIMGADLGDEAGYGDGSQGGAEA
ncbi:hypothetical protein K435DRAFT_866707 [Dendrothele bispora CBS 962.96]|uniref:Uncharacterized protein n=1 Tax=Dendrothele bispora (strain CBS 962.96) TaxID=1314807 RepID=A0A4S8LG86_DENBC|nr:hypothetical protein K435DRAFT_866707 [Dendrothele bispora CBS 962.96]